MELYQYLILAGLTAYLLKPLLTNDLTRQKAGELRRNGAVIIDVRSEEEFRKARIQEAMNLPLGEIKDRIQTSVKKKDRVILLYCRAGNRSFTAKRILKGEGYTNVYNLGSLRRAKKMLANA
jgi:phage shock protein E